MRIDLQLQVSSVDLMNAESQIFFITFLILVLERLVRFR